MLSFLKPPSYYIYPEQQLTNQRVVWIIVARALHPRLNPQNMGRGHRHG